MLTVNTGDGMSTRQDRGFSIELEHNFQISISIIAFSEQLSNVFFLLFCTEKVMNPDKEYLCRNIGGASGQGEVDPGVTYGDGQFVPGPANIIAGRKRENQRNKE